MYSIEPAYIVRDQLIRVLMKASTDPENKWFFTDGAFVAENQIERLPNTWNSENFVVVAGAEIIAYFEGIWNKPLNIISSLRLLLIDKTQKVTFTKAVFQFLDYLFIARGAKAINWIVAEKNYKARNTYEKFIKKYFGHIIGKRHFGQKLIKELSHELRQTPAAGAALGFRLHCNYQPYPLAENQRLLEFPVGCL